MIFNAVHAFCTVSGILEVPFHINVYWYHVDYQNILGIDAIPIPIGLVLSHHQWTSTFTTSRHETLQAYFEEDWVACLDNYKFTGGLLQRTFTISQKHHEIYTWKFIVQLLK